MSGLLVSAEVAERIRKSVSWVNHARQDGTGPRYLKVGWQVRYRREDVDAWLEGQSRTRVWDFDLPSKEKASRAGGVTHPNP